MAGLSIAISATSCETAEAPNPVTAKPLHSFAGRGQRSLLRDATPDSGMMWGRPMRSGTVVASLSRTVLMPSR
jgi:hypothetical protein